MKLYTYYKDEEGKKVSLHDLICEFLDDEYFIDQSLYDWIREITLDGIISPAGEESHEFDIPKRYIKKMQI